MLPHAALLHSRRSCRQLRLSRKNARNLKRALQSIDAHLYSIWSSADCENGQYSRIVQAQQWQSEVCGHCIAPLILAHGFHTHYHRCPSAYFAGHGFSKPVLLYQRAEHWMHCNTLIILSASIGSQMYCPGGAQRLAA